MVDEALEQGFHVSADARGFARLSWTAGVAITGPLVAEAMAAIDHLNDDLERPLLVEMARTESPDLDARQHFGRRCTASRIALLGESNVDRVRASFAPRGHGGGFPVPTQFFVSEEEALAWLLGVPADP